MEITLKNKNAIVCGSTQGIGKATASELALMGANVTLIARDKNKLASVISSLDTKQGQSHSYLCVDFRNSDELRTNLKSIDKNYHILINNTGGPKGGPISVAELSEFTNTFEQHLLCNHLLAQAVLPGMRERGHGRIINVISTSVKSPLNGLGVSNTIRGAVANWSKTLANEEGKHGIRINNVLPGATNTARLNDIIEAKSSKTGQSRETIETNMTGIIPAGRFGEPQEIGAAIAFLCTPAAEYISGINLPVDGGRTTCL